MDLRFSPHENPCCCSLAAQLCVALCDPMDCSMPGFLALHHLLEFAQTHVHWVEDGNQPSHPLSSPSPPALNLSQHQDTSNESALHIVWPKFWNFSFSISPSNEYSGLISLRIDWFDLLRVLDFTQSWEDRVGDCSLGSFVFLHLLWIRSTICSGLSFQGCLYSEQIGNTEICVSLRNKMPFYL